LPRIEAGCALPKNRGEMISKQDKNTVRVKNEGEILTKQDEHTVRSDHHADVENEDELLTK
jgi:hypothetical protein